MYKVLRSTRSAVRFSLKKSKKYLLENRYQESLILLWFSFGGPNKRVSYSTGYTVSYADWDYQKQRVKTNKSRVINSHTVNNYLYNVSKKWTSYHFNIRERFYYFSIFRTVIQLISLGSHEQISKLQFGFRHILSKYEKCHTYRR